MKKLIGFFTAGLLAFFVSFVLTSFTFAQEVASVIEPSSEGDVLKAVFGLVSDYKQMSAFAIALALTQLLRMILSLPALGSLFPNLTSQMKLVVISLLAVVSGVLSLRVSGVGWLESFIHSGTLAAVQVFLHQWHKEFIQKPKQI